MAVVTETPTRLFVVPCCRAKLDRPAAARDLYASAHFQWALQQVETAAGEVGGTVRILSALNGLVNPDAVLEPYDVTISSENSISPKALAVQLRVLAPNRKTDVRAFLPAVYLAVLQAAARYANQDHLAAVTVHDAYTNAPGISYQRRVLAQLTTARSEE